MFSLIPTKPTAAVALIAAPALALVACGDDEVAPPVAAELPACTATLDGVVRADPAGELQMCRDGSWSPWVPPPGTEVGKRALTEAESDAECGGRGGVRLYKWTEVGTPDGVLGPGEEAIDLATVCHGQSAIDGEGQIWAVGTERFDAGDEPVACGTRAGSRVITWLDVDEDGELDADEDARPIGLVCDGDAGTSVSTVPLSQAERDAECGGRDGFKVEVYDGNGDPIPDRSRYICHGRDGVSFGLSVAELPAGATCPAGGLEVSSWIEVGVPNGTLDAGEDADVRAVCNGSTYAFRTTALASSAACPAGGYTVERGIDGDGDGDIDAGAPVATWEVCNGAAGIGHGVQLVEVASAACASGQALVAQVWNDLDGDLIFDPPGEEVTSERTVCKPRDGESSSVSVAAFDGERGACRDGGLVLTVQNPGQNPADYVVCNGADGVSHGIASEVLAPGATCPDGGLLVTLWREQGVVDGVRQAGETIVSERALCNGADGRSHAFASEELVAGGECPAGGYRLTRGPDADGDGVIDPGSDTDSYTLCHGADAIGNGIRVVESPSCEGGGARIQVWVDDDGDLEYDEGIEALVAERDICNPRDGVSPAIDVESFSGARGMCTDGGISLTIANPGGVPFTRHVCHGSDGHTPQIVATRVDTTPHCTGGAVILSIDDDETYVCDGDTGATGTGIGLLVEEIPPGSVCSAGGLRMTTWPDTDGDGALSADEDATRHSVCNGQPAMYTADSWAELPACDAAREGYLYYLTDDREFAQCVAGGWQSLEVRGPRGDSVAIRVVTFVGGDCAGRGTRFTAWTDANDNGAIDSDETASVSTSFVCDGDEGPRGRNGTSGAYAADDADLGTCTGARSGQLYYVASRDAFVVCSGTTWLEVLRPGGEQPADPFGEFLLECDRFIDGRMTALEEQVFEDLLDDMSLALPFSIDQCEDAEHRLGLVTRIEYTASGTGGARRFPLHLVRMLHNLEIVRLQNYYVDSLEPLRGKVDLTYLAFDGGSLSDSDYQNLAGLTELETLDIQNGVLTDIGFAATLPSLVRLGIHASDRGDITDISALAHTPNLRYLSLNDQRVQSLEPLRYLSLTELGIAMEAGPVSLDPLATHTGMTELAVFDGDVLDIDAVAGMTGLRGLSLYTESLTSLVPLAGKDQLRWLFLLNPTVDYGEPGHIPGALSDLSPLAGNTSLEDIIIIGYRISDIGPLMDNPRLGWLNLSYNEVADLSPIVIGDNPGLRGVAFMFNAFDSLGSYAGPLPARPLGDVILRHNPQLTDVDGIAYLLGADGGAPAIDWVDLSETGVSDLRAFADLDAPTFFRFRSGSRGGVGARLDGTPYAAANDECPATANGEATYCYLGE